MAKEALQTGEILLEQARSGVSVLRDLSQDCVKKIASSLGIQFQIAAEVFKSGNQWSRAGDAFREMEEMRQLSDNCSFPGVTEAAECYRKVDPHKAIECLQKSIPRDVDNYYYMRAATHHELIGEIYEKDVGNLQLAAENFEQAADFNCKGSHKVECMAKAAQLWADSNDFPKAAHLFEVLGREAMHGSLEQKDSAMYHFFNACLCHLSISVLNCQQALQQFAVRHPSFTKSREYQLLQELVEIANKDKPDTRAFTKAIDEFKKTSRLQPWTEKRLNSIKEAPKPKQPELT